MSQPPRPPAVAASAPLSDDLDRPLYGATMGQAFARFWKKFAVFTGRASRSELWWMALIGLIVEIAFTVLDLALTGGDPSAALDLLGPGGIMSLICGSVGFQLPTRCIDVAGLKRESGHESIADPEQRVHRSLCRNLRDRQTHPFRKRASNQLLNRLNRHGQLIGVHGHRESMTRLDWKAKWLSLHHREAPRLQFRSQPATRRPRTYRQVIR
jgi:hypothetical protein